MLKQFLSKKSQKSLKYDSDKSSRSDSSPSTIDSSRALIRTGCWSHIDEDSSLAQASTTKESSVPLFLLMNMTVGITQPSMPFKDVPNNDEKLNLFMSKLSLCCVTFDFTNPNCNKDIMMQRYLKRRILIELVDFVASWYDGNNKFNETTILAMRGMFTINLFRVFPPNYSDDGEPRFDSAWPHLQFVYELLLKFITSPGLDVKIAKKYIDYSFILKLLDLFESGDPRERDCLKTILHRLYGKFTMHRSYIRKSVNNIFYSFVYENEKHRGFGELLEFYGSVISGFTLPLKEEHKIFLWRVLIPLHKPKSLGVYFQQLSYCIMLFIEKEQKLSSIVIRGLLKYWPITNSQKEVLFLGEIEEILESIHMVEFQRIMVPLFWRIGCCINSSHSQVAEKSLLLWNNERIANLIAQNCQTILPIIFPALERNIKSHWNSEVVTLTHNIRKTFLDMDKKLFLSCHSRLKEQKVILNLEAEKRKEAWKRLDHVASLKHPLIGNNNHNNSTISSFSPSKTS
ncbi:hypothetical protein Ahy_B06g085503 [Arachis hypogaea]|uniref:Serine/threonine protein phosphatase 2A regulatory subunit n=1 Tax=Arachis hypogaea TaxID=3818 RepID=A0A444YUU4_ARAHY|nr:hypothetical protein Ahy_B06g085503 [Arachis hypogaea]